MYDEKPYFVGHLEFGGHLELPNDANLASYRFQIRIPIPTYFCKNIFYRRYCTVVLSSCRTTTLYQPELKSFADYILTLYSIDTRFNTSTADCF